MKKEKKENLYPLVMAWRHRGSANALDKRRCNIFEIQMNKENLANNSVLSLKSTIFWLLQRHYGRRIHVTYNSTHKYCYELLQRKLWKVEVFPRFFRSFVFCLICNDCFSDTQKSTMRILILGLLLVGETEKCWPHIVLNMVLNYVSGGKIKRNRRFLFFAGGRSAKK